MNSEMEFLLTLCIFIILWIVVMRLSAKCSQWDIVAKYYAIDTPFLGTIWYTRFLKVNRVLYNYIKNGTFNIIVLYYNL
jgi:hypothetical protein